MRKEEGKSKRAGDRIEEEGRRDGMRKEEEVKSKRGGDRIEEEGRREGMRKKRRERVRGREVG